MKTEVINNDKSIDCGSSTIGKNMHGDNHSAEAELTSLSWLQSLDITSASNLPTPPCSPSPPPIVKQPRKKLSPLIKAELGKLKSLISNS